MKLGSLNGGMDDECNNISVVEIQIGNIWDAGWVLSSECHYLGEERWLVVWAWPSNLITNPHQLDIKLTTHNGKIKK